MYQDFYGLRELPFELTPNPEYLFLSPDHREALSSLQHGVHARKALTLLVGKPGTGKTTIIRTLLKRIDSVGAYYLYINNPRLTRSEFVEMLAAGFRLSRDAVASKATLLRELEHTLKAHTSDGRLTALIVDEAQSLPEDLLEEIRLLANIETESVKLLPVVLAGQPSLAERLNQPSLWQLKQRVSLRCDLRPFDLHGTAAYVQARIRKAGAPSSRLFTREAVTLIHERSGGIPRIINTLCDNALVTGFAAEVKPVTRALVLEVCKDFDLSGSEILATAEPNGLPLPGRFEMPSWVGRHETDAYSDWNIAEPQGNGPPATVLSADEAATAVRVRRFRLF